MVWGLAWHPEGHMLVSTGNDHKLRFWGQNRPKDDKPKLPPFPNIGASITSTSIDKPKHFKD